MVPDPQPVKAVLAARRITNRQVARLYKCSEHFVGRVINGYVSPPARFRAVLAAYLDLPESDLFRISAAEVLVQRSRAAQRLPERVSDPQALARVAALLADNEPHRAAS